ncbi:MAG TPA: hypothetical protein VEY14_05375, partial [Nocardioidaceae bacterium]|nr:hypothetical protein [Nocardioidaceae bacterium]
RRRGTHARRHAGRRWVVPGMMAEVLLVTLLGAFFIAFSRSGSTDRLPLRDLTARQLGVALLDGIATFHRLHEQRRGARSTTGLTAADVLVPLENRIARG